MSHCNSQRNSGGCYVREPCRAVPSAASGTGDRSQAAGTGERRDPSGWRQGPTEPVTRRALYRVRLVRRLWGLYAGMNKSQAEIVRKATSFDMSRVVDYAYGNGTENEYGDG